MEKEILKKKKTFKGSVVSNKMKDTVVVLVNRYVKHPKYKKYFKQSKKYKADDKGNKANEGDVVLIQECKPISKDKSFKVIEIVSKSKAGLIENKDAE